MRSIYPEYWAHPMHNREAWLAKWPAAKRAALLRSIEECEKLVPGKCQADVKRECLSSDPSKARLIQYYYNLRTQAEFGGQFYALQKVMTSKLRGYTMGTTDITFGSGLNATEIALWMDEVAARGAKYYYERDGKCWDATMSRIHSDLRISAYAMVDPALAAFAQACVDVKVIHKHYKTRRPVLSWEVIGTVKSGHSDTTLGNSLVNAMITVCVFNSLNIRASIIVAGDDLLVAAYDDFDIDEVMKREKEYGIKPEARKLASPDDTSFISGIFVPLAGKHAFIPKPGRLLAKLWWTVKPPPRRLLPAYRRGVALGLWPSCKHVPIVRAFLSPYVDLPVNPIYNSRGYKFHGCEVAGHPDLERWFLKRYNTTTSEVARAEKLILEQYGEVCLITHPLLEEMCRVDLGDICDREIDYVAQAKSKTTF